MADKKVKSRYTDTSTGYVKNYIPGRGVVDEQVVVMEKKLGRRLRKGEDVHHKDHNPQNNAPSNLELETHKEHGRMEGGRRGNPKKK